MAFERKRSHMSSPRRLARALAVIPLVLTLAIAAQSAGAAKPLAPPKVGPWKIIAAVNTPKGVEVKGGVVGGFRVTKHKTIAGFHLRFTEEGESRSCAGGEGYEESVAKSGSIRFAPGATAPIIHANGEWLVALGTGSLGGGSLQGVEVPVITSPYGNSSTGLTYITLATRKGLRSGNIDWASQ